MEPSPSLSAWRQFLDRLPSDHPLRRLAIEAAERSVEDEVLRLAAIVESSDDAILSKTLDGRILSWNAAATRIYGYQAEEVLGRHVSLLVPPGRPDDTDEILERIRQGEGVDHYETTRVRNDGRLIEVSLTVSPVRDAGGRITAASTIARDITERKRAERQVEFLAHASSELGSSLDFQTTLRAVARLAVPDLADWCTVDVVDEAGELRRVAMSQSDPAHESEARELADNYPPPTRPGTPAWKALETRKPRLLPPVTDEMLRELAQDGRHLELLRAFGFHSAFVVPLVARDRVLGVLTFALSGNRRPYDSSDLMFGDELGRRAALAIDNARLYGEAQTANRMKDEFLATLSHELRTPLTPILGWTRILRGGHVDQETTDRALEVIERNAEAQSRLIGDLLDLSRIVSGKLLLDMKPTDLTSVIDSAVDAVLPTAEARGVSVERHLDAGGVIVFADPDRIRQVAWNLLTNAVKFTPRGGRVSVRLSRANSSLELEVSDTGEGFSPEFQPYIFTRFHQADSSTTRLHGGLGLGLAIVRHLVELHGGRVEARSQGKGQGAAFLVRLPILPSSRVPQRRTASDTRGTAPAEDWPAVQGLRVLVVDDEEDAREMLRTLLSMRQAEVFTASSAMEALRQVAAVRPDVILADIGMPEMDGYEMLQRLRQWPAERGGRTPAIALTAYARPQDRERALGSGFQDHLSKPVAPRDLYEALQRVTMARR